MPELPEHLEPFYRVTPTQPTDRPPYEFDDYYCESEGAACASAREFLQDAERGESVAVTITVVYMTRTKYEEIVG